MIRQRLLYAVAYISLLLVVFLGIMADILPYIFRDAHWTLMFVIGEAQNFYQPDQNGLYDGVAGFFSLPSPGHEGYPWGIGTVMVVIALAVFAASSFLLGRNERDSTPRW